MVKKIAGLCIIAAFAGWVGTASAGMISTTFASNNSFAGSMFDVTTFGSNLTITGLDVNLTSPGSTANVSLYTRTGSYVGFESTSAGWTLQDTVVVTSAGQDNATFVDIIDFLLSSSTTYGFYVTVSDYPSVYMNYTNGGNTYANADLQLDLGIGKGDPDFTGTSFSPRTWNGTIYYDVGAQVPAPATLALIGLGLAGLGWSRREKV